MLYTSKNGDNSNNKNNKNNNNMKYPSIFN